MVNRIALTLHRFGTWLAKVTAVDIGRHDDGLVPILQAGTPLDKSWPDLSKEFSDALEAWRNNPIARRLVSIITAYVVGETGLQLSHPDKEINDFITEFLNHPKNRIMLKQQDWSDELSRSGELFPVLFTNPGDGLSYVRMVPASRIQRIEWQEGDYETELYYYELTDNPLEKEKVWYSPKAPEAQIKRGKPIPPVMLHYAINRPVGAVRGESDLAPVLTWLKRYNRWLEDRVRLNAAMHAFLWLVKVPGKLVKVKQQQYKSPPAPGSIIVIDKEAEDWQPITPAIHASDAMQDGRAIRWMVVAGGPGIGLVDLGEAESANYATATAMGEQRRRFLGRRQAYFGWMLADLAATAWNRAIEAGLRKGDPITPADIIITRPDIAPEDNRQLASAAAQITNALRDLQELMGPSETFRRVALRIILKFAGEAITNEEFEAIVKPEPMAEPLKPQNGKQPSSLLEFLLEQQQ